MSGMVGIVNLDGAPVDPQLLRVMTRYLASRGPDAQEIWIDGNVGFGHTLLRTTWESVAEHQPHTLDGKTWITADCRVDAREELIHELAAHDHVPGKDAPDAELILHAYALWGEQCLDHLLGDFSFAIWDGHRRALFCARDHLGIKPFFYSQARGALIFSNTLNCMRLHPAVSNALDEVAIADFLLCDHGLDLGRSCFSAIRRLPPSHTLTLSGGVASPRRYWQLPSEDEIHYRRRGDYIERFLELLDVATRDRLRTDSVGIFMSGGLDSPTIAATAKRILSVSGASFDLRAHTVVFDRLVPDEERRYSQQAADAIGIPIRHYPADDYRFPSDKPDPKWYPPEPGSVLDRGRLIDIHRGPAAASRVLLRGDGADPLIDMSASALEPFLDRYGYRRLLKDYLWLLWTRRQVPRVGIRTLLRQSLFGPQRRTGFLYPEWIAPGLEQRLDLRSRWRARSEAVSSRRDELIDPYWPFCFESVDPGSMHLPAEVRYPFFDVRLVQYLLRLPTIPWCPEKTLLRVAMAGVLPSEVLRRPKTGVVGNPWALMVPPAHRRWWEPYLVPAGGLEAFVDVEVATATLGRVIYQAQTTEERRNIDLLRLSLRPISLSLWLRETACVSLSHTDF